MGFNMFKWFAAGSIIPSASWFAGFLESVLSDQELNLFGLYFTNIYKSCTPQLVPYRPPKSSWTLG